MFSMPPATTVLHSPTRMALVASMTALRPEPQTLCRVMAPAALGMPP